MTFSQTLQIWFVWIVHVALGEDFFFLLLMEIVGSVLVYAREQLEVWRRNHVYLYLLWGAIPSHSPCEGYFLNIFLGKKKSSFCHIIKLYTNAHILDYLLTPLYLVLSRADGGGEVRILDLNVYRCWEVPNFVWIQRSLKKYSSMFQINDFFFVKSKSLKLSLIHMKFRILYVVVIFLKNLFMKICNYSLFC